MIAAISARVISPFGSMMVALLPYSKPLSTAALTASAYHADLSKSRKSVALRATVFAADALTASDVTGELLFVGQPDQGPGLVVQCWKVTLSLSGEVGLISEELASIPMTGEVLADDLNHPESPFFRVRYLG